MRRQEKLLCGLWFLQASAPAVALMGLSWRRPKNLLASFGVAWMGGLGTIFAYLRLWPAPKACELSTAVHHAPSAFCLSELVCRYCRVLSYFYMFMWTSPLPLAYSCFVLQRTFWKDGHDKCMQKIRWLPLYPIRVFLSSLPKAWSAKDDLDSSFLVRLVHENYRHISYDMLFFFLGAGHHTSIAEYYQTESKTFWRKTMSSHGCTVALEVARWNGKTGELEWKAPLPEGKDLICKAEYGGMGKGDVFLTYGKDFSNKEEAERKLTEAFTGKKQSFIVLERIMPLARLGTHFFEINTIASPDDDVHVVAGDFFKISDTYQLCTALPDSMHFFCPESGRVLGRNQWFTKAKTCGYNAALDGTVIPDMKAKVDLAKKMHKSIMEKLPAVRQIGWDLMCTEDGGTVWFEGNCSLLRGGRMFFNSWEVVRCYIQRFGAQHQRAYCNWAWLR